VTARRSRAAREDVRREKPAGVACGRGDGTGGVLGWVKDEDPDKGNGCGRIPPVGVMGEVVEIVGRGGRLRAEGLPMGDDLLLSSPLSAVVSGVRMLLSKLD
jgi:hypothetical protein